MLGNNISPPSWWLLMLASLLLIQLVFSQMGPDFITRSTGQNQHTEDAFDITSSLHFRKHNLKATKTGYLRTMVNRKIPFILHRHGITAPQSLSSSSTDNNDNNDNNNSNNSCEPIYMVLVARHGTRNPTSKDSKKIENFVNAIKKLNLSPDSKYYWMKHWAENFRITTPEEYGALRRMGQEEHIGIGRRTKNRFTQLFQDESKVWIQATEIPRAISSAKGFSVGLFGHEVQPEITGKKGQDPLLRFFDKICPGYQKQKDCKSKAIIEAQSAVDQTMNQIAQSLSKAIGGGEEIITKPMVAVMYTLCSFSLADPYTDEESRQFCNIFEDSPLLPQMENLQNLKDYYTKGPAKEVNYKPGCFLLHNMIEELFDAAKKHANQNQNRKTAHLMFAHAETIIPYASILGLYEPNHPEKWKSFEISPFAANIAFVLHYCPSLAKDTSVISEKQLIRFPGITPFVSLPSPAYRVELLHNEQSKPFPRCQEALDHKDIVGNKCYLDDLRAGYEEYLGGNCARLFGELCQTDVTTMMNEKQKDEDHENKDKKDKKDKKKDKKKKDDTDTCPKHE